MASEGKCEEEHCFLLKGHDGLHQALARIYDMGEDVVLEEASVFHIVFPTEEVK